MCSKEKVLNIALGGVTIPLVTQKNPTPAQGSPSGEILCTPRSWDDLRRLLPRAIRSYNYAAIVTPWDLKQNKFPFWRLNESEPDDRWRHFQDKLADPESVYGKTPLRVIAARGVTMKTECGHKIEGCDILIIQVLTG